MIAHCGGGANTSAGLVYGSKDLAGLRRVIESLLSWYGSLELAWLWPMARGQSLACTQEAPMASERQGCTRSTRQSCELRPEELTLGRRCWSRGARGFLDEVGVQPIMVVSLRKDMAEDGMTSRMNLRLIPA